MCGIFGIVGPGPFFGAELAAASRLLRHRGPDDEGMLIAGAQGASCFGGEDTPQTVLDSRIAYTPRARLQTERQFKSGGVALGHRRLSILDLSAHGHQPMSRRDRYWIVFNGEVYNHLELRREFESQGHRFTTGTDTEVILAAYAEHGPDCLSRFNGMWGLAILDLEAKTLFLARDRFGVKPLYYGISGGRLAFASEIKAFSAFSAWRPRVNLPRLLDFLVWEVTDHTSETMFEGVSQLPAGHSLLLDVSGPLERGGQLAAQQPRPQRWYTLRAKRGIADAAGELRAELTESIRLRLRADVPVGSCLSGGLDSSSIVCLMGGLLERAGGGNGFKSFTAGSSDREFDESCFASAVAARARSEGIFVTPEPAKLFDDLSRLAWHQDEPFVSSSIFAQWCVFETARRSGVIVMLDGQGADEILCGYRGFLGAYLAGFVRRGDLVGWARELSAIKRRTGFSRTRSLGYTGAYLMPGMLNLIGWFDHRAYADRGWLSPECAFGFAADPIRRAGGRVPSITQMSIAQVSTTNLPMLLRWEDRNSMAFSVEARVPFLDYHLVELSLGFHDSEKLGAGIPKAVLRRAMRGIVPDIVLDRRDKMGFVTAESLWMRRDFSTRFREELVTAIDALPRILSPTLLRRFDEVLAGRRPFDHRYWRAISAARWASAFSVTM